MKSASVFGTREFRKIRHALPFLRSQRSDAVPTFGDSSEVKI